jgi:hypothetical protein
VTALAALLVASAMVSAPVDLTIWIRNVRRFPMFRRLRAPY